MIANRTRTFSARTALGPHEVDMVRQCQATDGCLDALALELEYASTEDLMRAVAETLGMDYVDLSMATIDSSVLRRFPLRLIHRYGVFPLEYRDGALLVATSNPFDLTSLDAVGAAVPESVVPVIALADELARLVKLHLGVGAETIDDLIAIREQQDHRIEVLDEPEWDRSEASEAAQEASVVRLVNEILVEAIEARASDIHMEAQAGGLKIRYRIDGVLQTQPAPPQIHRFRPRLSAA